MKTPSEEYFHRTIYAVWNSIQEQEEGRQKKISGFDLFPGIRSTPSLTRLLRWRDQQDWFGLGAFALDSLTRTTRPLIEPKCGILPARVSKRALSNSIKWEDQLLSSAAVLVGFFTAVPAMFCENARQHRGTKTRPGSARRRPPRRLFPWTCAGVCPTRP